MAEPILVQNDEEVTDVLERMRGHPEREVVLVVSADSALAESRFNFRLLALQAEQHRKRVVVESDDGRVLALAGAAGLATVGGARMAAPVAPEPEPEPAAAVVAAGAVPPFEELDGGFEDGEEEYGYDDPPYASRYGPWHPEQFAAMGARGPGAGDRRRLLFYGVAAVILLIGIVAVVVLVPSATITLTTTSQQFSYPVDLTSQPGSSADGIVVRTQSADKQVSGSFQATGTKNTPGAKASGTVQYQNKCGPLPLQVTQGAVVSSQSGVSFAQQKTVTIDPNQSQTAPIQAQSDGSNGNVAAGQITTLQNAGVYASCLKVTNPQATSGGQDAKHQTLVTQQDLTAAQNQLEQQAKQSLESQLAGAVRSGEKQSDTNPVLFGTPQFTADHPAGSAASGFSATLTLKGVSAYYRPTQVSSAFRAALQSRVPAGRQLTPDDFVAEYQTSASTAGALEFKGQAMGRTAPRLDLAGIQKHLAGSSTAAAEAYLRSLPVSGVTIRQAPLPLPLLPFLRSRISVDYVIQQPAAPSPSPTLGSGSSQH